MWTFLRDERGTTPIEYSLIAAIVSVGIIATLTSMTDAINGTYEYIILSCDPAFNP